MKKVKNLKRVLGVLLTGLIGINAAGFSAIADNNLELTSTTDIFTWIVYENIAYPESLVEDYQTILNNNTELLFMCIARESCVSRRPQKAAVFLYISVFWKYMKRGR